MNIFTAALLKKPRYFYACIVNTIDTRDICAPKISTRELRVLIFIILSQNADIPVI